LRNFSFSWQYDASATGAVLFFFFIAPPTTEISTLHFSRFRDGASIFNQLCISALKRLLVVLLNKMILAVDNTM
ncbi:hypothetical protein, partial [Limosilactobacillus reuteri]|uniref:hypothetical protein n=1 Tax=Limosilactobacillus reuteri TaxID=1598 RepID=UPI001CDC33E3